MLSIVLIHVFIPMLILANNPVVVPDVSPKAAQVEVSRGEEPRTEKRIMTVTAYTNKDKGMNGKGITTSGEKTIEGRTIAAPKEIPLGSEIYIPALDHTYTVVDRGGVIKGNRLDLYMDKRSDAFDFGVQDLEVWIRN